MHVYYMAYACTHAANTPAATHLVRERLHPVLELVGRLAVRQALFMQPLGPGTGCLQI